MVPKTRTNNKDSIHDKDTFPSVMLLCLTVTLTIKVNVITENLHYHINPLFCAVLFNNVFKSDSVSLALVPCKGSTIPHCISDQI